jgi:hypothetical protein
MKNSLYSMATILFLLPVTSMAACPPVPLGVSMDLPCCATSMMSGGGRCLAPAIRYEMTLLSVGLEKSDGSELRFGTPRAFDVAGADAGRVLGDFLTGAELTPATYIALRPNLAPQMTMATAVRTADGRSCRGTITAIPRRPNGGEYNRCQAGEPNATVRACSSDNGLSLRDTLPSFAGTNNTAITLNISFDIHNAVICVFNAGQDDTNLIEAGILSFRVSSSLSGGP